MPATAAWGTVASMDRSSEALYRELPTVHAIALRLHDRSVAVPDIAAALDVAPEAVPTLLQVAQAKLRELAAKGVP